jgi:hypothetical protein
VAGATVVYSEDRQHDQTYDRVRVENPVLPGTSCALKVLATKPRIERNLLAILGARFKTQGVGLS